MKRLFTATLILCLLLALCACGGEKTAAPATNSAAAPGESAAPDVLPLGVITRGTAETRYENEHLGFGCRLDGDWFVANEQEMAQLAGLVLDAFEGTKYEETLSKAPAFFDFYAENVELPASINLNISSAGGAAGITQEQYLSLAQTELKQGLEAGGMQNVQTELRTVTFAGAETKVVRFYALNQGVDYYGLQVYFTTGDRFATLTLGTFGADKTEELLELFYALG